jgi:hypothetical protein
MSAQHLQHPDRLRVLVLVSAVVLYQLPKEQKLNLPSH